MEFLFSILFLIGGAVLLPYFILRRSKAEVAAHKGIMVVEVKPGRNLKTYSSRGEIYGYDKLTLKPVRLGYTITQQGSQAKIALLGEWERVDENTIKGIVNFANDGSPAWVGSTELVLKIGEILPIGCKKYRSLRIVAINPYSPLIKITQLYATGEAS